MVRAAVMDEVVQILMALGDAQAYVAGEPIRYGHWTIERLPNYAPRGWAWQHDDCDGPESKLHGWGFWLMDAWESIEMKEGRL